jgi:hypothetical protein
MVEFQRRLRSGIMRQFIGEDLSGSRFERVRLGGSEFERVDFSGSAFHDVDLVDARLRTVRMRDVVMRGVELVDVQINGYVDRLRINGVEVMGLVHAELDRLHPDRPRMRPTDPAGFREAWDLLERLWAGTVDRARRLDPPRLNESVDGEWSFIETVRHLVFVTDSWVRRAILGDPAPWHPLALPFDEMPDVPGVVPRDRDARPSLEEMLAIRGERMATVRQVVDGLTDESLAAATVPVAAPGWPPPESFPVRQCLRILLDEEWEHRLYAERDLATLEGRGLADGSAS